MEKDKAAKKAKLERERALSGAGTAGKAGNGRQDPPWLRPGITVKVSGVDRTHFAWDKEAASQHMMK